jgi:acyl-CoA thioesterase II
MDRRIADLLSLLELEALEVNLFRGESRDIGAPQVFGGQVLGQALVAASKTVEGRVVHSLHSYFLRSFSSRRVVAIQHGEQIFTMAASFQIAEAGFDHQSPMPQVPPPEQLPDSSKPPRELLERLPEPRRRLLESPRPFEFRTVEPFGTPGKNAPVRRHVWFRAVSRVPDEEALHRCLLAYVSDYNLLDTATLPHGAPYLAGKVVMASVDHAMWFHRPLRVDDWLLYAVESPSASGARGFARADIFSRDGRLVASTAQEGLVRVVS